MGEDPHAATITAFYRGLQERDHLAMAACYHPEIHFSDPVFTDLHGAEARAMWHMLCAQGTDLTVTVDDVAADDHRGRARWEARYTFKPTGRFVHNEIEASFVFEEGKIVRHVDDFDLWRWTRQALGTIGVLTGWTGFTQDKVREAADLNLHRFMEEHPDYRGRE